MNSDARRTTTRRTTARRAAAALVAGVLLLAGCSTPAKEQSSVGSGSPSPDASTGGSAGGSGAPAGFEEFYGQSLEWSGCEDGFECATASAPLSWHDADAGSIELALVRSRAQGRDRDKVGSLLVNPGGPGASGTDFVRSAVGTFGEPVKESFDIVGFDPRGVGESTAVRCFDDARKDESLSKDFGTDDAGLAAMADEAEAWGEACAESTGELLGQVDTQSAARDMDLMRAVLGDEKLNYLGYSYGTQLGATYAGLFPDRAGRLVLDGAIDTSLSADDISKGQAVGFENALRAYVTDCQGGPDCPLTGSVDDGMRQVRAVLDQAYERPYPTSDPNRDVTQTLAFYGVAVTLYDEASWPLLTQALDEAINEGKGDVLLYLADFYNDRNADGSFATNSSEGFRAVNCLDDRGTTDVDEMRANAAEIEDVAPTMGRFFAYGGVTCADWPYPEAEQEFDLHAKGAPPIVVVGTTNDPATPYVWAEGLADTLETATLVTYEGEGHTAYGRSNDCVAKAVEGYLVDGTVPEDGLTC
ncbi:alpha/beta hydrolase [Isoptericola hypogeus]|uniref:Alpha/beta hydrolase n=1 Tax=Isoptericola hypogeus TaxID=300179 RepID=A0ABP4V719_9MICO